MNDADLLMFGCAVSFIALAGCHVFLRERYESRQQPVRAQTRVRKLPKVA